MPYKDPEKSRENQARYRARNRERCRAAAKKHYQKMKALGGRTWENNNKDRVRKYRREWARANYVPSDRVVQTPEERAEKARANARRYKEKNPERVKLMTEDWVRRNRERVREIKRSWAKNHPDYMREKARLEMQARRAAKAGVPGCVTKEMWDQVCRAYLMCCAYCGERLERPTMDHIVPIALGGKHEITNLAPACRPCNSSKGNRPLETWKGRAA